MDFMRSSWVGIMLIVVGLMMAVAGCRAPLDGLVLTANELKAKRDTALATLEDSYQDHADSIVYDDSLNVAEKRAKWKEVRSEFGPAFQAHEAFRVYWKFLRAAVEFAQSGDEPNMVKLLGMIEELRKFLAEMSAHPPPPDGRLNMEPL